MAYRVGVDIGGTFTDFCAFNDETNVIHTLKVLSAPENPGSEVMHGIRELHARYGIGAEDIDYFTHGTTVGVNTVIQRKGIRLCLFVTENFADVLEVARLKMPDPYDLLSTRPQPLVDRERVLEIRERVRSDGGIEEEPDEESIRTALVRAKSMGAEGIVVALINSYRNPANEHKVKSIVQGEDPELPVFCSADVWPIIREYERTTTAVVHGYVQPRVSYYLSSLERALSEVGVPALPQVTKSNGGIMSAESGREDCVQMLLSGTAAGVIGASYISSLSGFDNTMSLDIGGTSADVAFIRNALPQYGVGEVIGDFPIYVPSVAVTSIGAGGGSIAWVDDLGVLRVGPESAGSTPGPACYGRGGERPTTTDAFAILGYIGQFDIGYSAIDVDVEKSRSAMESIAKRLELSVEETAQAIIDISVSGMYMEVSKLISRYAIDPREFVMQAFGGAGPMMGCFLAKELGLGKVIVPSTPGVLSALGGLIADIKNDFISTVFLELAESEISGIQSGFAHLREQAVTWLREEQGYTGDFKLIYAGDMRYRGQAFELETTLNWEDLKAGNLRELAESFHLEHEKVYEHCDREAPVQIVNLRLVIVGESPKPVFTWKEPVHKLAASQGIVDVFIAGKLEKIPLYQREHMSSGDTLDGPAVVAQSDCTTCVPPGITGQVDGYGNLILTVHTP